MKVFAISDPHLSFTVNKPMTIFGEHWNNYWDIICEDWKKKVTKDDIVLVAGDISWGNNFEESKADIDALAALPGTIVIGKGNHDYWWSSMAKMKAWLPKNIIPLYNNCLRFNNVLVCGTRLWNVYPNATEEDKRILQKHEIPRLNLSLEAMEKERKEGDKVICMLHFPPFDLSYQENEFTKLFEEHKIDKVVYGHLHGDVCKTFPYKNINGIDYYLTACDQVNHHLVTIYEE